MRIDPSSPICPYFTPKRENFSIPPYENYYAPWYPYFMYNPFNLLALYYMMFPAHLMLYPFYYMMFNPIQWTYPVFSYPMLFYPMFFYPPIFYSMPFY